MEMCEWTRTAYEESERITDQLMMKKSAGGIMGGCVLGSRAEVMVTSPSPAGNNNDHCGCTGARRHCVR